MPQRGLGTSWGRCANGPVRLLLQVSVNETLREAMASAHWITSGAFVVGYVSHLFVKRNGGWDG